MDDYPLLRDTGLPVAVEIAEWMLTRNDLSNSLASLTLWSKVYGPVNDPNQPDAQTIAGSLFRDAITQFVGCFDEKNAFPLVVETVYPSVEGIAEAFRFLRSLRNSYTSHRHGAARQCVVGIAVHPITGEYGGNGHLMTVYHGPAAETHDNLLGIVGMAVRFVDARIADLQHQLDAEARAMTPAQRLKMPSAVLQAGPAELRKSRGDLRRARERDSGGGK